MSIYLLDSDHLSLHQRGYETLKTYLLKYPPENIFISIVSAEELMRGRLAQIRRADQPDDRIRAYYWFSKTMDFLCGFSVLKYDPRAEAYFQSMQAKKIRIGTQDLKIASIALSNEAVLITRNRRDFGQIPGLVMEDWSVD